MPRNRRNLRGRLATAANAARIDACTVQRQTLLDSHFVLPSVAEVVFVTEPFVDAKAEVGEADSFCIGREANTADLADAVIPAVDVEPMEMRIRPAKRNLERVVKIGDRAIAAHQQPAPDHRADLANPHVNPVSFAAQGVGHDGLSLAKACCPAYR